MNLYVILAVYAILSLVFALQDLRHGEIPRLAMWCGIALVIGARFAFLGIGQGLTGLAGCAAGFGIYFLVYILAKGKLGLGDVWYAAFTGCVFGPAWWYAVSIASCVLALGYMGIWRLRSVAFIPFMAAGGAAVLPFFLKYAVSR